MSLIVSLSSFPPFILLWLSFFLLELHIMTAADPDRSPLLLLFLCFQDTIVFLLRLFLFFSRAFFEGPLLKRFPVILLALSLNLNWLRWSGLGLVPRPWLPKPVCDINGPCTSSSSLWILLACGRPLMLPLWFFVWSNCESQLSLAGCKSVWKTKGMRRKVIRKFKRTKKVGGKTKPPIWLDSLARDEDVRLPQCLQEKSVLNRQSRGDNGSVLGDVVSTFFLNFIQHPLIVPQVDRIC